MDAVPLGAPKEKSDVVMPLPTADQYRVVPDATLVVVIVVLISDPSLMVVVEGVSKLDGSAGGVSEVSLILTDVLAT